jgi:mannose-6-phosphate isomerase-like protein (cupin superfamily)
MKYEKSIRPWGWHRVLIKIGEKAWIKVVFVKQGERLSLQSHEERIEIWIVLKGKVETLVNDKNRVLKPGGILKINRKEKHRMGGIQNSYILELAFGRPSETDIIRYEDDYGRAEKL